MFDRILVANRGEIACRVIRTARRMGLSTVAVHSDADAGARHVRMADEAIRIGPPEAAASYLDGERILDAARRTGAQAVHPGYGFLSENAGFAEACAAAGLVFVGPPPAAIRAMGSKSAAKALMAAAGVPVVPGWHGDDQRADGLAAQAGAIGWPVLIKAVAGGGGRGMRRVDRPEDFAAALDACRREALGAFGDDRVLLERWVQRPRHVEIQVFADLHGGCVHLFERDCSVQRRHQKVLEEAPAPGLTPARRAAMGRAAVDAARAVGYVGAGTVEFIVAPDGSFWFMEMNTRLQVEHPVTEMITGLDLVEWQLRVAAGEPLPRAQHELAIDGHAIEARLYAEDPARGFLPSTGRLVHLAPPPEDAHVRVDTGVEQGDAITPHYDAMIAKLVVHDTDRPRAIARMRAALARYRVAGVANNVAFLARLVATRSFVDADLDTGLIEREADALFAPPDPVPDDAWTLAALAELLHEQRLAREAAARAPDPDSPWRAADGWRLNAPARRQVVLRHGDEVRAIDASALTGMLGDDGELRARIGDRSVRATVVLEGAQRHVFADAGRWTLLRVDPLDAEAADEPADDGLRAPMPGRVVTWLAQPGDAVERDAPLLVLEAMKMEHTIRAPAAGTVRAFRFAPGEQVAEGDGLVEFERG